MHAKEIAPGIFEKRLSSRERDEPESIARLTRETTLLRLLGGSVTPMVLASGNDATGPWLQTARLPFPTLSSRLTDVKGGLPRDWIERASRAAFCALGTVHEAADARGPLCLVHGDISPANLAIDDAGDAAMFLDLELAVYRDAPFEVGAFRGTIAYAAPEIARGEGPTVRSDLFALAATLLHAATGKTPREGPSLAAVLVRAADVPLLGTTRDERRAFEEFAERGPGHAAIVACLEHDPADRPATARSALAALA